MLLDQKVIFLTGGSEGIGWECAQAYARHGAQVAIAAIPEEGVRRAAEELGPKHLGVTCDVSDDGQVARAVSQTIKHFGRLDAIHNNAGIAHPSKALHETTPEEWENLINVNLRGIYYTTRHGLDALRETRGSILNTSSLVATIGQETHAAYSATKGAIDTLTKSMAIDYAPYGIRVNGVSPAAVLTPMLRKWCAEQPNPSDIQQKLNSLHPLGPCPEGDVIADPCVFLLSDMARFITGCILPVSGGAELGYRR
jgi:NAD(P)-dependent dehydrogenase (short-subunit alcohol dehydrogenase family)